MWVCVEYKILWQDTGKHSQTATNFTFRIKYLILRSQITKRKHLSSSIFKWRKCSSPDRASSYKSVSFLYSSIQLLISSSEWHLSLHFIYTYWRVSAGSHLKSSGNSPEAWEMRMSRSRDQRLCLMKGALPIKHAVRLLLMTHQQGQ